MTRKQLFDETRRVYRALLTAIADGTIATRADVFDWIEAELDSNTVLATEAADILKWTDKLAGMEEQSGGLTGTDAERARVILEVEMWKAMQSIDADPRAIVTRPDKVSFARAVLDG